MTVEAAGAACGLGRSAAYEAARRGELPTIRFGRRLACPTARVRQLLGIDAAIGSPDSETQPGLALVTDARQVRYAP